MSLRFPTLCLYATSSTVVLTVSWMAAADRTWLSAPAAVMTAAAGLASLIAVPACVGWAVAWSARAGQLAADRAHRRPRPLPVRENVARHAVAPATMATRVVVPDPVKPDAAPTADEMAAIAEAMEATAVYEDGFNFTDWWQREPRDLYAHDAQDVSR
jgi:hypothetical protein